MITPRQWQHFSSLRKEGWSLAKAAREANIGESTARARERGLKDSSGRAWSASKEVAEANIPSPIPISELSPVARDCLDDFERYRRRYLGHVSTPWQVETAQTVVDLLASPHKEFVVENAPPGGGKTTLLHDIGCWVTTRDRRIRGCMGSRIENNGRRTMRRIRRTLERTKPFKAKSEDIERGLAVNAEECLAKDYGLFKPVVNDIWRADEFVVAQWDDIPLDEREPTWSCYGMDSGVLSNRFNVIFWDDVVDKATTRTLDAIVAQQAWWDDEAETRLEPDGVLMLVGQRMAAVDLYRYCLNKVVMPDPDEADDEEVEAEAERPKMYHHIVYKAHDETKCQGRETHRASAAAWPEGCLLDPHRLPWRDLRVIANTKPRNYAVSYQQEDVDPEGTLAKDTWIYGGIDPEDGTVCPGCVDEDRDLCELPSGLAGPLISTATVDPSGKKMWALQWWVAAPASEQSFLMDLERKAMPANELLDWNANEGRFVGWMEEWQARSVALGHPITAWIVEINAAQRYLLAYDHVRRWMAKWGVSILPHTTGPRKLDEDHGPWIMRTMFQHGNIRLPFKQAVYGTGMGGARIQSLKLIDEATKWPNAGTTDDQVMGAWMHFLHLPKFVKAAGPKEGRLWQPPRWFRRSA